MASIEPLHLENLVFMNLVDNKKGEGRIAAEFGNEFVRYLES